MAFWQITYGGVTQEAAAWGISNLKRKRKSAETDIVTFNLDGTKFDTSPLPFAYKQALSITRNGQRWFAGIVTSPQPKANADAESIDYEISGPWWYLENTVFQQQWVSGNPYTGGADTTQTTTQSDVILGQSFEGIQMNTGQVLMEVLLYAQYAFQLIPYPTTVVDGFLPAPPAMAAPFIIGTITPSITGPYSQVRDRSCADIIRLVMKYSPDAVAWMDYSTSPPTLNIAQRSTLVGKKISVLDGTCVGGFNPAPQDKLQVPVVVAKFQQKQSANGQEQSFLTVDSYPPPPAGVDKGAWESQPGAWVQTIDLVGGGTTWQSAPIGTVPRPVSAKDEVASSWFLYKEHWLKLTNQGGDPLYDSDPKNYDIVYVNTVIDPNDPLCQAPAKENNPNNITFANPPTDADINDCPQLVNELIPGAFPPWLQEDPNNLDAAKVVIEIWAKYVGTNEAVKAFFTFDPAHLSVPTEPGAGYLVRKYACKVTNASTQTYEQVTSVDAAEPVPTGFAQYLYNALKQLHFAGELTMVERECSDQLPPGCIFNATDGNPDWKTMDALVLSVDEDIDKGKTTVQFGPPLMLGLGELAELFRANLGRLPSWKLSQRTTGKYTAASNVIGNVHAADTHTVAVPGGAAAAPGPNKPFEILDASDKTGLKVTINPNSFLQNSLDPTDIFAITGLGTANPISVQVGTQIWLEVDFTGYEATAATINSGMAGWSGWPTPFAFSGSYPNQTLTKAFLLIGYLAATTSTLDGTTITGGPANAPVSAKIIQCVSQDILLQNVVFNGLAAVFPFPHHAPSV